MPTYHACNITVCLGSVPLTETTTSDVVLRKGEVAKRQSETAEKKLLHSSYLRDKRVLFPGDPDGFELNWLGNAPFMQVEADDGFARSPRPNGSPLQDRIAQALTLHVKLSDKALHSGFTGKTHLKMEVLFNGQLSACSLIHANDIRSGAKSLHQVFSGYRVDFLAERPWVLLPPFTTADGGARRFRRTITPLERFNEISTSILKEAKERGTNKSGDSPPSAVFLNALAQMQAPVCVMDMQKPGGRKFGVLDVVITAGTGNKPITGTSYLKSPQRLKDPDYIMRAGPESKIESESGPAVVGANETLDEADEYLEAANESLDDGHTDAGGFTDIQNGRPPKRRAFSLAKGVSCRTTQGTVFQTPFSGMQVPCISPPEPLVSHQDESTIAGRGSQRCPSLEHSSDGHKEPLPSNDRYGAYDAACEPPEMNGWHNNGSHALQGHLPLPPKLSSNIPQPLRAPSTLISMPSSDSVTGHGGFNDLSFPKPTLCLSPMAQTRSGSGPYFPQPVWPGGNDTSVPSMSPCPAIPNVAPTAWMIPSATSWPASSSPVALPYRRPINLPQQAQSTLYTLDPSACLHPSGLSSPLSHIPDFFSHPGSAPFATPTMPSSPAFPKCESLPPTALFSVTSNSRTSASPTKGMATVDSNEYCSSVLISRVVISFNNRSVVDHCCKVPQRIILNHGRSLKGNAGDQAETPNLECDKLKTKSRARQWRGPHNKTIQTNYRATSPIEEGNISNGEQGLREKRRDSAQDGQADQATRLPLPYLKRHQGSLKENWPINARIDVPDNIAPFVSAAVLAKSTPVLSPSSTQTHMHMPSVQPAATQRRTYSRNATPGIQGPKAATFLLDDPEEVLREAARTRRSKSPTKPAATVYTAPTTPAAQIGKECLSGSSPLSSVPGSPLPESPIEASSTAFVPPGRISQLDGLADSASPVDLSHRLAEAPPGKASLPTPQLQRSGLAALPSALAVPKKRKLTQQSPTRTPRDPDRLSTVNNPPLNDDCVIAFAESSKSGAEKRILRQVKGERQGLFKEEYVVLAVRFFVAGG